MCAQAMYFITKCQHFEIFITDIKELSEMKFVIIGQTTLPNILETQIELGYSEGRM
jgi:hypothetical protein